MSTCYISRLVVDQGFAVFGLFLLFVIWFAFYPLPIPLYSPHLTMPPTDPRNAELSRIKNKMVEVEAALKEQKKISGKLRETQEKKMYEVAMVDKEIATEIEKYRWNKGKLENQIRTCTEEANAKIREYMAQETELMVETAGFDVLERENERLNKKFKDLVLEKDSLDKAYDLEKEQRNDKDFNTRMQMEEILRKVIRSNDKNYNKDAVR